VTTARPAKGPSGSSGPRRVTVTPATVSLDAPMVEALQTRLAARRPMRSGGGWELGVPADWLEELLTQWAGHDVGALQRRLDGLEHRMVDIDGQLVHAVQVKGTGPDPVPLVMTNGWPSSFLEHLEVAALLADPGCHGGDPADAFTVVLPSLPGYGWSAPPPAGGVTAAAVADLWRALMVDGLGHRRFVAHGSDLGAGVTAWLARRHRDAVTAIHLATPSFPEPPPPRTAAEEAYVSQAASWAAEEGAYAHQHATRPATLAAALLDSPAGLAAWIAEKAVSWSSPGEDGAPTFPRGLLLDTLTLYWCTATIGTSLLPYWSYRHQPGTALPAGDPPPVPTAVSVFGGERVPFPKPPRELAERYVQVTAWNDEPSGGHFPAVAAPSRLVEILRDTLGPHRPA
jgi:pimeloyl-ACP methyl ester carboxylesterase